MQLSRQEATHPHSIGARAGSGGGGEGPGGLLGGSVHVEGAALRVLQLQPAWRQRGRLLAEQGSCTAEAASRALCTDHQPQCQLCERLNLGGLVAPSGLVSEHEEDILCPTSCKTEYM